MGLIDCAASQGSLVMGGYLNAHFPMWSSPTPNFLGKQLFPVVYDGGLVPLNDLEHTYMSVPGHLSNNLDLVFSSVCLASISTVIVGDNNYYLDYNPLFGSLNASPSLSCFTSNRFNFWPVYSTEKSRNSPFVLSMSP